MLKNKINGTILKVYSISCKPNGNIEFILSLKSSWLGLIKKDKKNVFINEEKEINSVAKYCLGKFLRKNKLETILDNEIETPRIKDIKKLIKIL